MRPRRDLTSLQGAALRRLEALRGHTVGVLVREQQSSDDGHFASGVDGNIAFVTIELYNLWSSVARNLYLALALGARDATGRYLSVQVPRPTSEEEAVGHAVKRCRPSIYKRRKGQGPWKWQDEPDWWDPVELLKAIDAIGSAHLSTVSGSLSNSPSAFTYLRSFRNFYAHRGRDTRRRLLPVMGQLQMPSRYTATEALVARGRTRRGLRPQALILDWLDDVRDTVDLLA